MGISVKYFALDPDGTYHRVPWSRMERLFQGNERERFQAYAGQGVRFATLYFETIDRRPFRLLRCEFSVIHFDLTGRLDEEAKLRAMHLAGASIDTIRDPDLPPNIADMRPKLAGRAYRREFQWKPTEEQIDRLRKIVGGQWSIEPS